MLEVSLFYLISKYISNYVINIINTMLHDYLIYSRSIYGCIGVQDHEYSWQKNYDLLPFGVCSQFIKKGSGINLSEYVQQTQHIAENWTYLYDR
jgi:hypothetical protein